MIQLKLVDRKGGPARGWGHLRTGPNHDKGGPRSWLRLVYRRTGDRDVIEITKCSKAASAGICGTHCTGPNHELAPLVMTKERAVAMAEPSVLPLACSM